MLTAQVDEERIKDPAAVKPDDWDEDAPKTIPDEEAVMPSGWLSDEPLTVRVIATLERGTRRDVKTGSPLPDCGNRRALCVGSAYSFFFLLRAPN